MKKLLPYLIIFINSISYANDTPQCNTSSLEVGTYISDNFVYELQQTRTGDEPKVTEDTISAIVVTETNPNKMMFIWNMHEGDINRLLTEDCSLIREDHALELKDENYKIIKNSNNKFTITIGNHGTLKFHKVNSLNQEIAKIIISGKYRDNFGNTYLFNKNGEVKINNTRKQYRLIVDRFEFNVYVLAISNKNNSEFMYEMYWRKNTLSLKQIHSEETRTLASEDIFLTPLTEQ